MSLNRVIFLGIMSLSIYAEALGQVPGTVQIYPANGQNLVNPDVQLKITFNKQPVLGNSGKIYIFDADNDQLVDELDMGIPPGPKNSRTPEVYKNIIYKVEKDYRENYINEEGKVIVQVPLEDIYQKKYLGGKLESDVYHFYPVLVNNNTAIICPRNNKLGEIKSMPVTLELE